MYFITTNMQLSGADKVQSYLFKGTDPVTSCFTSKGTIFAQCVQSVQSQNFLDTTPKPLSKVLPLFL